MKYLILITKKLIFGFFLLYSFNIISSNFNIIIPINVITILFVSFLGFPALFSFIMLYFLIY